MRSTFALLTLLVSVLTWDASAAAPAPSAKAPAPGYLRAAPKAQSAAPASPGSTIPKVLALVLVVGLGGFALYAKMRRRAGVGLKKRSSTLRVLDTARLGPKAALVTAQVGQRVILLGVTDQNIAKLGWLTPELESEAEAHSEALPDSMPPAAGDLPVRDGVLDSDEPTAAEAPLVAPAVQVRKVRPSDGSFASRLRSALGAKPGAPSDDALAVSAELTRDVVDLRRGRQRARAQASRREPVRTEEAMIDVEAQAAGLIRRLKDKNQ